MNAVVCLQEVRKREDDEIRAAKSYFNRFKHKNIAQVTRNNEKFEPEKLTTAMLQKHNELMTQTILKEPDTKISPGPFVTRLRKVANDAVSSPDMRRKPINRHNKPDSKDAVVGEKTSARKRPASAENKKSRSVIGSRSEDSLPKIGHSSRPPQQSGASRRDGSESGSRKSGSRSSRSRLTSREMGANSIEWDVETGLLPLLSDNPAYRDWETSDMSLKFLEERVRWQLLQLQCLEYCTPLSFQIKEFSMKQNPKLQRQSLEHLPPLRRYEAKVDTDSKVRFESNLRLRFCVALGRDGATAEAWRSSDG